VLGKRIKKIAIIVVSALLFVFIALIVVANLLRGRMTGPDEMGSLRTINTSEVTYASTYGKGFAPSLESLGCKNSTDAPNAVHSCLIDSVLASGTKSGYRFSYSSSRPDKDGIINEYLVVQEPLEIRASEAYTYCTDETGVIRRTRTRTRCTRTSEAINLFRD
jgi:hypothetical protein